MSIPPHDQDVKYAKVDLGCVDDSYKVAADADEVTITLDCPRCHGTSITRIPRGMAGTKAFSWFTNKNYEADKTTAVAETLFCECGFTHPEQPESPVFDGCGAQWTLKPLSGGTP